MAGLLLVVLRTRTRSCGVLTAQLSAEARGNVASASSHRAAVVDRMYNGALALDYMQSLKLLDPEVCLMRNQAVPLFSFATVLSYATKGSVDRRTYPRAPNTTPSLSPEA